MRVELVLLTLALACVWFGYGTLGNGADGFDPSALRADGVRRAVTWNVGSADGAAGSALRGEHVSTVLAALRVLDPDLVFLQELASREQARQLASGWAPDVEMLVGVRGGRPGALLARRGALSDLGSRGRTIEAVWRDDVLGAVQLAAVHADAFSARRRNASIGAAVDRLLDSRISPRLLFGDLNLEIGLEGRQDLSTDDAHLDLETYNYVARFLTDAGRDAGPTAEPDRRLDHVFVSSDLRVVQARVWRGRRASGMDHDPLVVDLQRRGGGR